MRFVCPLLSAVVLLGTASLVHAQTTVTSTNLVSTERVGRTLFEYTYTVSLQNGTAPLSGAVMSVSSTSPSVTVLTGSVFVGSVPANSAITPTDTYTIRVDRTVPFDPSSVHFSVSNLASGPSVSAVIGPNGGTLIVPGGGSLLVPPGALSVPTTLSMTEVPAAATSAAGSVAVSPEYLLEPRTVGFAVPVQLTIPYDPTLLSSSSLSDADVGTYVLMTNGTYALVGNDVDDPGAESPQQQLDPVNHTVTVNLWGFSRLKTLATNGYSKFGPPSTQTQPVSGGLASIVVRQPLASAGGLRTTIPVYESCLGPNNLHVITQTPLGAARTASAITKILLHSTNDGTSTAYFGSVLNYVLGCTRYFAQYYIDRDGQIYQVADDLTPTQHTRDANQYATNANSIGIELFDAVGEPYDGRQVTALAQLIDYLMVKYSIPRPSRDAASGLLTRDPATQSIVTHSENDPGKKCDPAGIFQNTLTPQQVAFVKNPKGKLEATCVDKSLTLNLPWKPAPAGAHPALVDAVVDTLSVLDRAREHTGVINTSGGTAVSVTDHAEPAGSVTIAENAANAFAAVGNTAVTSAANNDVVFAPAGGQCIALNTGQPPVSGHVYSDIILGGQCTLTGQNFSLLSSGGFYLGPAAQLLLNNVGNATNMILTSRGAANIQGLWDATGNDGNSSGGLTAGKGGSVTITAAMGGDWLLPTIVAVGGSSPGSGDSAGGLAAAGGNVTINTSTSHLFFGGGTGSTVTESVPPLIRANFLSTLPPPPIAIGDNLPPPPPFNLVSVGTLTPVSGQFTPLRKLPSQFGFARGIVTSGGMGGFGAPPAGTGGAGGTISITSAGGTVTLRNVDLTTGADVESIRYNIFLSDGIQHAYFAATGSLGGMGTLRSNAGPGGNAGSLNLILSGAAKLDPAPTTTSVLGSVYGYGAPGAPFAPSVSDSVLDPRFVLGQVKQITSSDGTILYRLRIDPNGNLAGGSGGIPGGSPLLVFPGTFGAQGAGGTITGLLH